MIAAETQNVAVNIRMAPLGQHASWSAHLRSDGGRSGCNSAPNLRSEATGKEREREREWRRRRRKKQVYWPAGPEFPVARIELVAAVVIHHDASAG